MKGKEPGFTFYRQRHRRVLMLAAGVTVTSQSRVLLVYDLSTFTLRSAIDSLSLLTEESGNARPIFLRELLYGGEDNIASVLILTSLHQIRSAS